MLLHQLAPHTSVSDSAQATTLCRLRAAWPRPTLVPSLPISQSGHCPAKSRPTGPHNATRADGATTSRRCAITSRAARSIHKPTERYSAAAQRAARCAETAGSFPDHVESFVDEGPCASGAVQLNSSCFNVCVPHLLGRKNTPARTMSPAFREAGVVASASLPLVALCVCSRSASNLRCRRAVCQPGRRQLLCYPRPWAPPMAMPCASRQVGMVQQHMLWRRHAAMEKVMRPNKSVASPEVGAIATNILLFEVALREGCREQTHIPATCGPEIGKQIVSQCRSTCSWPLPCVRANRC